MRAKGFPNDLAHRLAKALRRKPEPDLEVRVEEDRRPVHMVMLAHTYHGFHHWFQFPGARSGTPFAVSPYSIPRLLVDARKDGAGIGKSLPPKAAKAL